METFKPLALYFCSMLLIAIVFLLSDFLYSNVNWASFLNGASLFIPPFFAVILVLLIFLAAIYLFRKANGINKKKSHARFF